MAAWLASFIVALLLVGDVEQFESVDRLTGSWGRIACEYGDFHGFQTRYWQ